jgi:hypothetical protein
MPLIDVALRIKVTQTAQRPSRTKCWLSDKSLLFQVLVIDDSCVCRNPKTPQIQTQKLGKGFCGARCVSAFGDAFKYASFDSADCEEVREKHPAIRARKPGSGKRTPVCPELVAGARRGRDRSRAAEMGAPDFFNAWSSASACVMGTISSRVP